MKTPQPSQPQPSDSSPRRGVIVMLFSVLFFSINTLLLKYLSVGERDISSMLPLLFRAGVGALIVIFLFRGRRPTRIKPVFTEGRLFLRGFSGLLGTAAYYWTVPTLGAGKSTLLCNTYVIFAAVIAALCLGEKLNAKRAGFLTVAFIGVFFLTGPSESGSGFSLGINEVIAILGALTAAWSVILIRQLVAYHSIVTIFLAQCVWIFLPVVFFTWHELPGLDAFEWFLLILAATMASCGQLMMNEGYRCLTVAVGASMQMLWPVLTALGGLAWFDERFAPLQILGAVLILFGTWRMSVEQK